MDEGFPAFAGPPPFIPPGFGAGRPDHHDPRYLQGPPPAQLFAPYAQHQQQQQPGFEPAEFEPPEFESYTQEQEQFHYQPGVSAMPPQPGGRGHPVVVPTPRVATPGVWAAMTQGPTFRKSVRAFESSYPREEYQGQSQGKPPAQILSAHENPGGWTTSRSSPADPCSCGSSFRGVPPQRLGRGDGLGNLSARLETARESWQHCKAAILDAIGGPEESPRPAMPPIRCCCRGSAEKPSIRAVGDCECPISARRTCCADEGPTRVFKRLGGSGSGTPQYEHRPMLHVTAAGPFMDKIEAVGEQRGDQRNGGGCCFAATDDISRRCNNVLMNMAHDVGMSVGTVCPVLRKEPPPAPRPPRPLQRLTPCFFPPPPPEEKPPCGGWLKKKKKQPAGPPPKGGIIGAIEDAACIGVGLAGMAVNGVANLLDSVAPPPKHHNCCSCPSPPLRYPRNGVYEDPPEMPTKASGWRAIDALNNFMDALTFPRSSLEKVATIKEPEDPPTEVTGNKVVDSINETLDKLFPPAKPRKTTDKYASTPVDALLSYLHPPPPPPRSATGVLPGCLRPDASGRTALERWLPPVCSGEASAPTGRCADDRRIDYVDFSLSPGAMVDAAAAEATAAPAATADHHIVVPFAKPSSNSS